MDVIHLDHHDLSPTQVQCLVIAIDFSNVRKTRDGKKHRRGTEDYACLSFQSWFACFFERWWMSLNEYSSLLLEMLNNCDLIMSPRIGVHQYLKRSRVTWYKPNMVIRKIILWCAYSILKVRRLLHEFHLCHPVYVCWSGTTQSLNQKGFGCDVMVRRLMIPLPLLVLVLVIGWCELNQTSDIFRLIYQRCYLLVRVSGSVDARFDGY